MVVACANKECNATWKENRHKLPCGTNLVSTSYTVVGCEKEEATWLYDYNLDQQLLTSEAFLRQVYDTVNNLNVASRPTKKLRKEAQAQVLGWGEEIQTSSVQVMAPGYCYPSGSIRVSFGCKNCRAMHMSCRLNPDLSIAATSTGFLFPRAWRLYDGRPIWP